MSCGSFGCGSGVVEPSGCGSPSYVGLATEARKDVTTYGCGFSMQTSCGNFNPHAYDTSNHYIGCGYSSGGQSSHYSTRCKQNTLKEILEDVNSINGMIAFISDVTGIPYEELKNRI